jgi:hypothetical protein
MFSNPAKFFKKNILLIGIVLLLIITAIYWLYINVKEGFDQPVPEKAQLISVSTIEKIYNNLPEQTYRDIAAPIVGLYKLFVDNYNDAFDVSLQIAAATKEADAAAASVPSSQPVNPDNINSRVDGYTPVMGSNKLKDNVKRDVLKKWAPIINPGIQRVLSNAIRWLPKAKQFYDKFVSNNYYGMLDGTLIQDNDAGRKTIISLYLLGANTLYEDDQLSILLGPDFAKSNPNPPIKLPATYEQFLQFTQQGSSQSLIQPAAIYFQKYMQTLGIPFMIIQKYLMEDAFLNTVNSIIPNTIVKLIEQLNTALANDVTDQATISQLTGQLNTALANDATDQATIHNLQGRVANLESRQVTPTQPMPVQPMPNQPMPNQPMPNRTMPNQPMPVQPMPGQPMPAKYQTGKQKCR